MSNKPFWQTKKLHEMTKEEWESLCDGCGLCCLQKLQDDETDEVYYTNLHCHYLDTSNNHCTTYKDRHEKDRKSTRLNSSHVRISYAVFCLKKKKKKTTPDRIQ